MTSNRNEHLRYRYGICLNDNCEKCKTKELQQIPLRKDFVCEECGKSLRECAPPKTFGQKYGKLIGIAGAIIVILGIVVALVAIPSKNESSNDMAGVADSVSADSVVLAEAPQKDAKSDSSVVKAEAENVQVAQTNSRQSAQEERGNPDKSASVQPTANAGQKSSNGTLRLPYGSWTGGSKNGQPDGTGTMTYSTTHTIDSRDTKGRVAQPGEYIVGEWDNGHLVQGRWFKNDGTKEAVIIGKAG